MPRPKVKGKVCQLPKINLFGPLISDPNKRDIIYLSIEEYETIRIIDFLQKSQEACAVDMDLSRASLQRIYYSAKQKIAESLVLGKLLKIEGGNYRLCNLDDDCFSCTHCLFNKHFKD
ncbi:MAG: DUF134 domain-containing protein [Acholeplasmataceae bacterium]